MKAVVFACDSGEGLKPLTKTMPKSFLPIGNTTLLEYNLKKLSDAGIDEIAIVTGYLGHKIKEKIGNKKITYLTASENSEAKINTFVDRDLIAIEGEWLFDDDINEAFLNIGKDTICGGIYTITKGTFKKLGLNNFRQEFIKCGAKLIPTNGEINRIENFSDYMSANHNKGVFLGRNIEIGGAGEIGVDTILGDRVTIGNGTVIKDSIVMEDTHIGENCEIENAIIGKGVLIKNGTFIFDLGVVAEGAKIGRNVLIKANGRVGPFKIIADESTVSDRETSSSSNEREVISSKIAGSLFGEITPEFATKCGKCTAHLFGGSKKIAVCTDGKLKSMPIFKAFMDGVCSGRDEVLDFKVKSYPAFYQMTINENPKCSVYIYSKNDECIIEFLDGKGEILSVYRQKQLQSALNKKNFDCPSVRGNIKPVDFDYGEFVKKSALESDISIKVECDDSSAEKILSFYKSREPYDICFCLSDKMDEFEIRGFGIRQTSVLLSVILNEENYPEKFITRLKKDAILGIVVIMNYMQKNKVSYDMLVEKIPSFVVVTREMSVKNEKREEITRLISGGKYGNKVKILKDGGQVLLVPHDQNNTYSVIAEGYNQAFAEDLADFYVHKIEDLEKEI